MKPIKCWHFLSSDKRLRWGTKEIVEVGKTYTATGDIEMCKNGLHGSKRILDALKYAPGPICCRVEIWGEVIQDIDKLVGRHRKVLQMIDAADILVKFARMCALDVVNLWDAPDVIIEYLKTGKEFIKDIARTAIRNPVRDKNRDDARAASWFAVWDGGRNASWYASWDAARASAWASTMATTGVYTDKKQNKRLTRMIKRAMEASK